eukprot:gnl/MRDRNA2_/MRDRNA2_432851_c0_seq1.p1 gnl/MRDRNA2_/MRDRNA2_432851_c0~~gnl/MRDRNA2_/MRDRNA2_432851_c0_seq1.p1  ORF type:complete len:211 (-),score=9.68 gnl/MRDRNA2_/MRDRNA2_432851_c0_seq1:14-586(-)
MSCQTAAAASREAAYALALSHFVLAGPDGIEQLYSELDTHSWRQVESRTRPGITYHYNASIGESLLKYSFELDFRGRASFINWCQGCVACGGHIFDNAVAHNGRSPLHYMCIDRHCADWPFNWEYSNFSHVSLLKVFQWLWDQEKALRRENSRAGKALILLIMAAKFTSCSVCKLNVSCWRYMAVFILCA